jgi:pimeloyl-ACP methyl ester carboxylesterase
MKRGFVGMIAAAHLSGIVEHATGAATWDRNGGNIMGVRTAAARTLRFDVSGPVISGDLTIPDGATGVVLFARGGGSSRANTADQRIADTLHRRGFATLLLDLFTHEELLIDAATERELPDVTLLSTRLIVATDSVSSRSPTWRLPLSFFAEGMGAAAAIMAAAVRPSRVWAIVSVGGRPDLAAGALGRVAAPTLFIVGDGDSPDVKRSNENAVRALRSPRDLVHVDGKSSPLGSADAVDQVARRTSDWLARHIAAATPRFQSVRPARSTRPTRSGTMR